MAPLLYNAKCTITRDVKVPDEYGGVVVSGTTIIAENEPCRLDYYIPKSTPDAPQGQETEKIYSIFFRSTRQHPINIREEDIVTIVFPPVHDEINSKFRVRGVQGESLHRQDPNSIIECTLVRYVESRGSDF